MESNIEKVYNAVLDGFKTNPDIKAIFVVGDNQVAPVVSALKEMDRLYPVDDRSGEKGAHRTPGNPAAEQTRIRPDGIPDSQYGPGPPQGADSLLHMGS